MDTLRRSDQQGLEPHKGSCEVPGEPLDLDGIRRGRAKIHNGTAPPLPPMPEADVADMEGFLQHIELVLPVLGFSFLKPRPSVGDQRNVATGATDTSPIFEFSSGDATAKAREIDGEFIVLKGSTATLEPRASWTSYRELRQQLVDDKKLVEIPDKGLLLFAEDVYLSSPSAGAAIVAAGNTNGRSAWKVAQTKQTYADWHQTQLPPESDSE
ncbi:DUF4357 domain-containing protein [Roseiconus lacunae]|nr:DUF4357 domain-containing protein [Roseiconus lacunae]